MKDTYYILKMKKNNINEYNNYITILLSFHKLMKIFYTGIGSNENGEHSPDDFLNIMNREFTNRDWTGVPPNHIQLQFEDWVLPIDFIHFTLTDWVEYSGAEMIEITNNIENVGTVYE